MILFMIMIPLSGILLFTWILINKWKAHGFFYILFVIWGILILGIVFLFLAQPYLKPMILTQQDIYGDYIIDRDKFPGKQADWQYDNFKFSITENDQLIFKARIYDNVWNLDTVKVSYSSGYYDLEKEQYCNRKLRVHSDSTTHHIIMDNPTLYRRSFNRFYYVFESKKFGNVFFKKGEWDKRWEFGL